MGIRQRFVLLAVADPAVRDAARAFLETEGFGVVEPSDPRHPLYRGEGRLPAGVVVTDLLEVAAMLIGSESGAAVVLLSESAQRLEGPIAVAAGIHQLIAAISIAETRRAVQQMLQLTLSMRMVAQPVTDERFRRAAWAAVLESEEQLLRGRALVASVENKLRERYPLAVVRARRRPGTPPDDELVWFFDRDGRSDAA